MFEQSLEPSSALGGGDFVSTNSTIYRMSAMDTPKVKPGNCFDEECLRRMLLWETK